MSASPYYVEADTPVVRLMRDPDGWPGRYPAVAVCRHHVDPVVWSLATRVLDRTSEAATVETLARTLAAAVTPDWWDLCTPSIQDDYRRKAHAVLDTLRTTTTTTTETGAQSDG
jgi:hypothetical protein